MPSWIPRQKTVQDQLADEIAKQEALRFVNQQRNETPAWTPMLPEPVNNISTTAKPVSRTGTALGIDPAISVRQTPRLTPIQQEIAGYMPAEYQTQSVPTTGMVTPNLGTSVQTQSLASPAAQSVAVTNPATPPVNKTEVKPAEPFWQRALQVFSAPFNWIDEYLIKPGLSIASTTVGAVANVQRKPGEDYFAWKRRSWDEWNAPGVDINVPWSDKPWRVDIKGVAEFAPWLLIPGAGQVGSATRAGVGIAGALGKAGKVGKVAGAIVEWSPWGLAEKTAGAAVKGTLKAGMKASEAVSTKLESKVFGKIKKPVQTQTEQELTQFFKDAVVPQRKAFEKALPELRAKQEAMAQKYLEQGRKGIIPQAQAVELAGKARAGGIKDQFSVMSVPLNDPKKTQEILSKINSGAETGLATVDDALSMRNLLLNGEIPEPAHIKSFAKIFGSEFADAVSSLRGVKRSALDTIWDILNIPRSVMASGDLSGTFRQGLILTLLHPVEGMKSFGKQLKAFASEKVTLELDDALRNHPLYNVAKNEWGVDFTAVVKGASRGKEEAFASQLAEALPMVRRSERAYTTYLNQMRMAAVEKAHATMISQGATKEQFKLLGDFINYSTGRGKIPFQYEKYAPMFNSLLFSPKYQASILQLPGQVGKMLISKNPYVRKEGAKALVTFVGGGSALIGLVSATGKGSVELDPRSVDFAKLKIGDTRVDIWRGYAQYVRFANQMLLGQRKSAYGNLSTAERGEIAGRFIQSKLSPVAGLFADLWRNETYDGTPVFSDTKGFVKSAKEHILPLAVQDVMDAMEQSGVNGLWTAVPANLGVGVMTYVNEYVNTKNKVAKDNGYESWDVIDPKTQLQIERNSPELQAAQIAYDRQTMGTAWGDWHLAGKAVEDVFRENVNLAVAQFKETGDGVQFREKVSDAYTQRKGGYEARTKEQRFADIVDRLNTQDPAQAMVTLGPEQMAIKTYNDALYGEDMYDQFGDYRYDEADIRKEQLQSMMGDKMFKYVEDYAGEKTADLPAEFQELKAAKIALRPYWEVADRIERLFGKRFAESNKGQAMISKMRKQMRATRPDIAKYYALFYANT